MALTALVFLIIMTLLITGGVYVNYWLYRNRAFTRPVNLGHPGVNSFTGYANRAFPW